MPDRIFSLVLVLISFVSALFFPLGAETIDYISTIMLYLTCVWAIFVSVSYALGNDTTNLIDMFLLWSGTTFAVLTAGNIPYGIQEQHAIQLSGVFGISVILVVGVSLWNTRG